MSNKQTRKQNLLQKSRIANDTLTCKPLENLNDIQAFLDYPPPWRSLCKELVPRSKFVIRNIEHRPSCEPVLESPEIFCHIDPDTEAPVRYDVTNKKLPKTLVCHDMANGYHDDSKIEGTQGYDSYTFYNWAGIDIFCYFSHHLITIPPVSWISVGHAHGVKVIGTIITEWGEGAQLWDSLLSSEMEYRNFASALVAIAKTMKFDGYLLNIENKISNPEYLLNFVRYLHKLLHEELVDPELIWYDSVTITGHLNWQNGLNAKNKAFFDICDGFFTNYSWTVKDVESSAVEAGDRITDLYIGIDVWGRNFYGGGQFNVQAAVKVAHEAGCSLAIFAPAWTREALSGAGGAGLDAALPEHFTALDEFLLRDRALWDSVWPFLNTHLPARLPFHSSFCRGHGKKRWMYGEVISPGPWYNLRHQQYQPNCNHGPHGYVLSTVDKIARLSFAIREDKGILKYRRDLENIRSSTFLKTKSADTHHDVVDADDESLHDLRFVKRRESFIKFQEMSTEEHDAAPETETLPDTNTVDEPPQTDQPATPTDSEIHNHKLTPKPSFKRLFMDKLKTIFKKGGSKSGHERNSIAATSTAIEANSAAQDREDTTGTDPKPLPTADASESAQDLTSSKMKISMNVNLNAAESKTRWALAHVAAERECLSWWFDDAFCGGASIKVNPSDSISTDHRTIRLFHCDFQCQDTLIVCVVTKDLVQSSDQYLNVKLVMENAAGQGLTVVLMGRSLGLATAIDKDSTGIVFAYPIHSEQQDAFRNLREYLLLNEPGFYVPVDNLYGWEVRYYEVKVPGSRVTELNCRTGLPQGGVLLGHLALCHRDTSGKSYIS